MVYATCRPKEQFKVYADAARSFSSKFLSSSEQASLPPPETLVKAEFTDLYGTGSVRLVLEPNRTGLTMSFDEMDLSRYT